jgi:hypothetical protein
MGTCYVCGKQTPPHDKYCGRCLALIKNKQEKLKRREAMRKAYDKEVDGFRDFWTDVVLDERDDGSPFSPCFDHYYPVRASRLVVTSELSNRLKAAFAPSEFPRAIAELARHHAGEPFDRDFIDFTHWNLRAPTPTGWRTGWVEMVNAASPGCRICGRPTAKLFRYCPRCHRFVTWNGTVRTVAVNAMKEAWSAEQGGFLCHFTGMRVEEADPRSPWFLTFDHRVPGERETLVVAAWWVNMMKSSLSELEFWRVVGEYDRYLHEGGEFDRDVVGFDYWRKARRERRRVHGS